MANPALTLRLEFMWAFPEPSGTATGRVATLGCPLPRLRAPASPAKKSGSVARCLRLASHVIASSRSSLNHNPSLAAASPKESHCAGRTEFWSEKHGPASEVCLPIPRIRASFPTPSASEARPSAALPRVRLRTFSQHPHSHPFRHLSCTYFQVLGSPR
jgi:hypothetical protein